MLASVFATRASAVVLAIFLTATSAVGTEQGTVEAFSSWEARGQIFPTGPQEATFVGALFGVLYVEGKTSEGEQRSIDAGLITCPGTVVIDVAEGRQMGEGRCVILTPDGERIYGKFTCSGTYLEGCNGEFTLVGGTGEKQNISGGGPIQLKSAFAHLTAMPGTMVQQATIGIALWPELNYKLP